VIAANKQDLPGAYSIEDVRRKTGTPVDVPIIGTSAVTGAGCVDAVRSLIDLIIARGRMRQVAK
jgi:signal recognition particle receptor subunit beta